MGRKDLPIMPGREQQGRRGRCHARSRALTPSMAAIIAVMTAAPRATRQQAAGAAVTRARGR